MKRDASGLSRNAIVLLGTCAIVALCIFNDSAYVPSASFAGEPGIRRNQGLMGRHGDPKTVQRVSRDPTKERVYGFLDATAALEVPGAYEPPPAGPPLALPNVLFLGAQKAGSTSISTWLFNGGVCRAETLPAEPPYFAKESHFFDQGDRFHQGVAFYLRRYQQCLDDGHEFIMDATPDYLTFPERIASVYGAHRAALSKLKLMVVLREPISRELSWYNHKYFFANSHGTGMTFEKHSSLLLKGKPDPKWASTGKYVDHLKKFASFVDRNNILVLSYDELKADPGKAQWRIREFLGGEFPGELNTLNTHDSPHKLREVSPRARRILEPFFRDKNEELYEFLEANPGPWMEQRPFPRFVLEPPDEGDGAAVSRGRA